MTWGYEELEERLRTYEAVSASRASTLLSVFFGIVGVTVVIVLLWFTDILPKLYVEIGFVAAFTAMALLAIYVAVSERAFHRNNGVYCQHCGASLVPFEAMLNELEAQGRGKPEHLKCPQCHSIVVRKKA